MENLRKENHVVPTGDLLSEIDSLEIHGGMSGGECDPNDTHFFCMGAKCACQDSKKDSGCVSTYLFCGQGTTCKS